MKFILPVISVIYAVSCFLRTKQGKETTQSIVNAVKKCDDNLSYERNKNIPK